LDCSLSFLASSALRFNDWYGGWGICGKVVESSADIGISPRVCSGRPASGVVCGWLLRNINSSDDPSSRCGGSARVLGVLCVFFIY